MRYVKHFVLALGCSLLAFGYAAQASAGIVDNAVSGAAESTVPDASVRCDDNLCFEACTSGGACDGFCISNICTCVGTSGPPCS
jgi:hypothetical protein